jgi:hypothetical protein
MPRHAPCVPQSSAPLTVPVVTKLPGKGQAGGSWLTDRPRPIRAHSAYAAWSRQSEMVALIFPPGSGQIASACSALTATPLHGRSVSGRSTASAWCPSPFPRCNHRGSRPLRGGRTKWSRRESNPRPLECDSEHGCQGRQRQTRSGVNTRDSRARSCLALHPFGMRARTNLGQFA